MRIATMLIASVMLTGAALTNEKDVTPEDELIVGSLFVLRAAIHCPSDDLPDERAASRMMTEALMVLGKSPMEAAEIVTETAQVIKDDGPLDRLYEGSCRGLAMAFSDLPERIDAFR